MNFDLPEELCILKDSVASFCETEITPKREAYDETPPSISDFLVHAGNWHGRRKAREVHFEGAVAFENFARPAF